MKGCMEIDNILTMPRWRILEIISNKPSSPLEISGMLQTSVAYVSQQLKLLEAANIVRKDKTGYVEKGKPRFLFSITKDILHLTILANNFSAKKVINLDEKSKIILRIWLIEQPELRYSLEKLYWLLERDLSNIRGIFLDNAQGKKPSLIILTDSDKLKLKSPQLYKEADNLFHISIIKNTDFKRSGSLISIYDPNLSTLVKEVKGGMI
jgi:hypothetical protein